MDNVLPATARGDASDTSPAAPTTASPARIEANRANATLSTGPRTAEGIARASSNALVHGLSARAVVIRGESREQWEGFRDATLADLDARGPVETALAARVAELLWRLQRAGAAEAAVADFALARAERASIMAGLDACDGPGDNSPFCFRSADTIADLRVRTLRAQAAGEVAQAAIVAADDARLDPAATGDVVRLVALAAGIGDPELVHGVASDEQARRIARGQNALSLPAWTAGGLRMVAAAMAASTGAPNFDDESDDEESDDEDASERARTPSTEGAALLCRARRVCLEATLRGLTAERDARQRLALAQGIASVSEESAPVRRHEAHLQRQLAGALALLDGARARRLPPAERTAETRDHRTGVRVVTHEPSAAHAELETEGVAAAVAGRRG